MHLSKIVSAISFVGALVLGIAVGSLTDDREEIAVMQAPCRSSQNRVVESIPVRPVAVQVEDLVGVWKGTWGYGREFCTIEIRRIDGNRFSGTLRKEGAEIAFAGTLDPDERTVFFRETKVLKLGEYSGWSLGTNAGSFSSDGRTLTGTGTDKWGTYGWDATKE
jgi:hypothetical protein